MVVYELKALVKLVLKDPDNEEYKNSIREIVNDHIRTYERPRDGEGYANYVHICCCPLMDNKFTKEFSHEIWSALDSREPLRIADE
jgi:hypothetical protein